MGSKKITPSYLRPRGTYVVHWVHTSK